MSLGERVEVREVGPDLVDDFLYFFDHDAFPDNPGWQSCYCFFSHFPHDPEGWAKRTTEQNRPAKEQLLRSGRSTGLLAYLDGRPIAWCHAARRSTTTFDGFVGENLPEPLDGAKVGHVVCYVIGPPHRRQGLARRLLREACAMFARSDLTWVEAYPLRSTNPQSKLPEHAQSYHGHLAMYLAEGFQEVGELGGTFKVVRKQL